MTNLSSKAIAEKPSVDINFASACLEAVGEVLKVTTNYEAIYQNNNGPDSPVEARGIQGKIYFSGDWQGEIIVAVPYSLAAQLTAKFVGCDPTNLDEGCISEGIGEIANQIAGRVATMLSREDCRIGISIPEISTSPKWHLPPSGSHTIFQFECKNLPFLLIVSAI